MKHGLFDRVYEASSTSLLSPDLVGVRINARPCLHDVTVGQVTVGEVKAEVTGLELDLVGGGVVPGLGCETAVALPDLHLNAASGG